MLMFGAVIDKATELRAWEAVVGTQEPLRSAGFTMTPRGGDPRLMANVALGGTLETLKFNATAAAIRFTPLSERQYHVASGATHSRLWLIPGMYEGGADTPAAIVLPLLDIGDETADALLPYVGMDPGPVHRATHVRRGAIQRAARPSEDVFWGYDEYATNRLAESRGQAG